MKACVYFTMKETMQCVCYVLIYQKRFAYLDSGSEVRSEILRQRQIPLDFTGNFTGKGRH
jgi:nicotinamide riboside transporter PnuC